MSEPRYLTQEEAAAACNKHKDTIRRYRYDGKLPWDTRDDGVVLVAVADLVTAGLLDPLAADGPVEQVAQRSRAERDLLAARQDLAVAHTRLDALTERLARADEEIAFLRALLENAAV